MVNQHIKIIFGGLVPGRPVDEVNQFLSKLQEHGVKNIDTAQLYGNSEELLGQAGAPSRFIVDTKHIGGFEGGQSTKDQVIARAEKSLENLKTDNVDVLYIHAPDRGTPLQETLAGINELHKANKFRRFGLSNFHAGEVEEVIRVAKENNYVLPTVYQGNYSAVSRRQEAELFPTLRKHGIAFYAYSPIAGGFLAKTKDQIVNPSSTRWSKDNKLGQLYHGLYDRPSYLTALDQWEQIAKDAGISRAELAYRWVAYHSVLRDELGDGIIVGASSVEQLGQSLQGLKNGPLSEDIAARVEGVWKTVEKDAPLDNFEVSTALRSQK